MSVMSRGPQDEGGLGAGGVRVVSVGPLPGVPVGLEGEVSGEEEDVGTGLAALTHPAAGQRDGKGGPGGQYRWVDL